MLENQENQKIKVPKRNDFQICCTIYQKKLAFDEKIII